MKPLPTVLTTQQQETALWTVVGIATASKQRNLTDRELTVAAEILRETHCLTLPEGQTWMLLSNARTEWASLLDLPPWK